MMRNRRLYQDAWEKLKADKKVVMAAPVAFHARIIKAIKKEKYNDLEYKYLLGEQGLEAVIASYTEQSRITVVLKVHKPLTLKDIL